MTNSSRSSSRHRKGRTTEGPGLDVVERRIVELVRLCDLVATVDVSLAAQVVTKGD